MPVVAVCICMGLAACSHNYTVRDKDPRSDVSSLDIWSG